jgi:hypothetical protein
MKNIIKLNLDREYNKQHLYIGAVLYGLEGDVWGTVTKINKYSISYTSEKYPNRVRNHPLRSLMGLCIKIK